MEKDLISIIIPIYNVGKYLERCIESIINQTYDNLQIILVNDGSSDSSGVICEKYKEIDNRITVIHKTNGGLADARNAGMKLVKGSYVGFVDSDDYVERDMYETLYCAIKSYNVAIACCGRVDLFEKEMARRPQRKFVLREITQYSKEAAIRALCLYDGMDFSVCDKLISVDLFEKIQFPKGRTSEDVPVVYELYNRTNGVIHIGKAKYYYCHRQNSISGRKFSFRRLDYLFFIQEIYKNLLIKYPEMKKEAEVLYYNAIIFIWRDIRGAYTKREKYQTIEAKLRRLVIRYFLRYIINPYTSREECKYLIRELWNKSI